MARAQRAKAASIDDPDRTRPAMNATRRDPAPHLRTGRRCGRAPYVVLAVATIALGLAVHRWGDVLSPVARDVLGDVLWATMIGWWVAVVAPASPLRWRIVVALAICYAVEVSQLWHPPTLDVLRRTTIGQLTLGSGFDRRDLASYTVGVFAAALIEVAVIERVLAARRGRATDRRSP